MNFNERRYDLSDEEPVLGARYSHSPELKHFGAAFYGSIKSAVTGHSDLS